MVDFVEKIFDDLRQDGLPLLLTLGNEKAILKLGFKTVAAARSAVFRCTFPLPLVECSGKIKFKLVDMARLLAGEAAPANAGPPLSQPQITPANILLRRSRGRPRKAFRSVVERSAK
ncbi:MAG: hypothetical protein PHU46_15065 [Rhodocyclaceae bacterium]|nr:hypothetical protein [Rhodocyclaceae bacterium]